MQPPTVKAGEGLVNQVGGPFQVVSEGRLIVFQWATPERSKPEVFTFPAVAAKRGSLSPLSRLLLLVEH